MKPRYIAHTGGPMPVPYGTEIETIDRDGSVELGNAGDWISDEQFWLFSDACHPDDHIIAYRVIEQE